MTPTEEKFHDFNRAECQVFCITRKDVINYDSMAY